MEIANAVTRTSIIYNPDDVAVINDIITKNVLKWNKAPSDGSEIPEDGWTTDIVWSNDETGKCIIELRLILESLSGELDVSALTELFVLSCEGNKLIALDLSGLTMLKILRCKNNQLTAMDLSKFGSTLTAFDGNGQNPAISLTGSGNRWRASVDFGADGNVAFTENTVFSYANKTLSSSDNSISKTGFTVQTGLEGKEQTGTLTLTLDVGELDETLLKLTDTFTEDLFSVDDVAIIIFPYSRAFCDVERFLYNEPMEDKYGQAFYYTKGVNLKPFRNDRSKDVVKEKDYHPHHSLIKEMFQTMNNPLLNDCHSFSKGIYPCTPFNTDKLPDFILGHNGKEREIGICDSIYRYLVDLGFKVNINQPYGGSLSVNNCASIMIEVNKRLYLSDDYLSKRSDYYKAKHIIL